MEEKGFKIGSVVSMPTALLLLIFFFMPWLRLSCGEKVMAKANGWQLTVGKMTPTEQQQEKDKDEEDPIKARPWFILCLILPVVGFVAGARGASGRILLSAAGKVLLVVGIVGMVMMILASNVDYSDDLKDKMESQVAENTGATQQPEDAPLGMDGAMEQMAQEMQKQAAEQMGQVINTKATAVVWLSLVLYILLAVCGVAELVLPAVLRSLHPAAPPPSQFPPSQPPAQI